MSTDGEITITVNSNNSGDNDDDCGCGCNPCCCDPCGGKQETSTQPVNINIVKKYYTSNAPCQPIAPVGYYNTGCGVPTVSCCPDADTECEEVPATEGEG